MRRLDVGNVAVVSVALVMTGFAAWPSTPPLARAIDVALAAGAAFMLGLRLGRSQALTIATEALAPLPQKVTLQRGEEGRITALVQRLDGAPAIYDVPQDVYDAGPVAVMTWLLSEAAEAE